MTVSRRRRRLSGSIQPATIRTTNDGNATMTTPTKTKWQGTVISIQPRIRLGRSFDQRHHSYLGYVLTMRGTIGGEAGEFVAAIGKGAQAKHEFRNGDEISGESIPVADPRLETAAYYKTSRMKLINRPEECAPSNSPPYFAIPPALEIYRERGHRRLAAQTYSKKCTACIWGCRMPVEMIIDQWNPSQKRYRFETFCYGPKSCSFYSPGPQRKVPGRKGMSWTEEDWVDEQETEHRED